jgi:hypothetical protein
MKYACVTRALPVLLILVSIGCKSAIETGHNTALDSVDLVKMTDDMAMQMGGDPDILAAYQKSGALKVVVEPVRNEMTAEVLPRGAATAFTARLRVLLSRHAPDRFTWVMNRDSWYRLRNGEVEGIDPGPAPEAINPHYALTATFRSLTSEDPKRRSAYYLCVYDLTDLEHRNVLWTGSYEVKKLAVKGFLD